MPDNTVTAQTVADLHAAADQIRRHGWTTGRYRNPETGGVCIDGAIRYAIAGTHQVETAAGSWERRRVSAACREVTAYLHDSGWQGGDLTDCNDWEATSPDEVVAVLETVAGLLADLIDGSKDGAR